jgi:hypothetical protein
MTITTLKIISYSSFQHCSRYLFVFLVDTLKLSRINVRTGAKASRYLIPSILDGERLTLRRKTGWEFMTSMLLFNLYKNFNYVIKFLAFIVNPKITPICLIEFILNLIISKRIIIPRFIHEM